MNYLGDIALGAGLAISIAALIANNWRPKRVKGFSPEDVELLSMPAHERVARALAVKAGAPEFMWRRYTPLAVSIILQRKP